MKNITKHPLRITADAFKNALMRNGFTLYDNGEYPELERTEINVKIFENPGAVKKPILLEDGRYALRTQLLPFALPKMAGSKGVMAASCGRIFDGECEEYPVKLFLEGVISNDMTFFDLRMLWKKIVKGALGAAYDAELVSLGKARTAADMASWGASAMKVHTLLEPASWSITATDPEGRDFILGYFGTLTWLGAAMLGREAQQMSSYAFSIDLDAAAVRQHGLPRREALFDNTQEALGAFPDGSVSAAGNFEDRCRDVLRTMGYSEGFGPKIYPDGIYKKMNMIQDEWDLNNKGVQLTEPLGEKVGLPTVLTPAIEQILSEKYAAGEASAKAFEISHIFMPQKDAAPIEKLALSFGAYGGEMTLQAFIEETGDFLTRIGNRNHFYIPTDLAIAYQSGECRLILDEKMQYLGGNFGGISEIAEKNFGLGIHGYMANLELMPLEQKAEEEYGYIAPELR